MMASAQDYMKRTALCLQLTGHTHSICAKMDPKALPVLVQLAQGKVRNAVVADFDRVAASLRLDPSLDSMAALTAMLGTLSETLIRFKQFETYPCLLYQLCGAYNPEYRLACVQFLSVPDDQLDPGFGLRIKLMALSRGSQQAALEFILQPSAQSGLEKAFAASGASSLPGERRFSQIKRSEAPRLCHVAVASRNQMLREFLRWAVK